MGKVTVLDSFNATISSQGPDRHVHIPRRMHEFLDEAQMMGKNLRITIKLEEIG